MTDKRSEASNDSPKNKKGADSNEEDRGQAIQINDNTIDDPNPPEADPGDDHLHSRTDFKKTDQALQINDNTVADED